MKPTLRRLSLAPLALALGVAAACGKGKELPPGPTTAPPAPPASATAAPPTQPATPAAGDGVTTGPGIDRPQTGLPHGLVVFESKQGEVAVDVEVAATDKQREIGLMFRRRLDPGTGMLFIMETERQQVFWMKNTLIPLDMVFVASDRRVVGVVENAEPLTLSPRAVDGASRFVVELPGGFARASGIAAGDRMRGDGVTGMP